MTDKLLQVIDAFFYHLGKEAEAKKKEHMLRVDETNTAIYRAMSKIRDISLGDLMHNSFLIIQPDIRSIGFYLVSFGRGVIVKSLMIRDEFSIMDMVRYFGDIVNKYNPLATFIDRSGFADRFYEEIKNSSHPVIPMSYERLRI